MTKLRDIYLTLSENPDMMIQIKGWTDPVGGTAVNKRISHRRAEAVKVWLVSQGIDAMRIEVFGLGIVTAKTFYGCMYEDIMRREQNDWETSIEKLLKMDTVAKVPTIGAVAPVDKTKEVSFSEKDQECRSNSSIETVEHRHGGDTSISDTITDK